ncbi:hypothetical protein B0H13DRAFT_2040049 [Mycena leptocephala]|nr:hypothetical protein B0H13DRAFT_2040049 [Mycena leptocephala]
MQLVNPDVLWWSEHIPNLGSRIPDVLTWLRAIQPTPESEDLIDRWECYNFILEWETSDRALATTIYQQHNLTRFFSLSPPALRMLQTKMSDQSLTSLADCRQFVVQFPEFIRILQVKGFYWMYHGMICSPLFLLLVLELYPIDLPSVASDLAVGLLHLMQRTGGRSLPINFR